MPRMTQKSFLKSLLIRYPGTILYHVGLLLFVFATLSKYGGVSIITGAGKHNERRDLEFKKFELDVDPSMPLDRVADEELAQWIEELLVKKPTDTAHRGGDDRVLGERRSRTEEKTRDEMNGNMFKHAMESVVVLGEGGSPRDRPTFSLKGGIPPNIPPGHLPVNKYLREKLARPAKLKPKQPATVTSVRQVVTNRSDTEEQRELHPDTHPFLGEATNPAVLTTPLPGYGVTRRANVLIVAAMRTGSSFLGELFRQRSDFFYMFEPGIQIMHKLDSLNLTRRVIYTKLIDMLHGFYRCKFNDIQFFIDELNGRTLNSRQQAIAALVTSQFCRKTQMPNHHSKKLICDPVSEKVLETACITRDNTAIKSIRILDINLMISAVKDPNLNLKLIHLVRDPRSMILSRLKLKFPTIEVFTLTHLSDTYRNILLKYCSNWLQNYEIGHYVPLIRKNYLMVRYEDLALEPYVYARKIYDFIGLGAEIPPGIQTWIDNNTNVNDPSRKKAAAFSTKRDSKEVLVRWKAKLTLDMAKAIENVGECSRLMKVTGYKLIGDDYFLLSNTDHLVDTFPVPEFDINAFDFM